MSLKLCDPRSHVNATAGHVSVVSSGAVSGASNVQGGAKLTPVADVSHTPESGEDLRVEVTAGPETHVFLFHFRARAGDPSR